MASSRDSADSDILKQLDDHIHYYQYMKATMEAALNREKEYHARNLRACAEGCDCVTVIEDFLFEINQGDALCRLMKDRWMLQYE